MLFGFMTDTTILHKGSFIKSCLRHQLKGNVTITYSWQPVVKYCFSLKEICTERKIIAFKIGSSKGYILVESSNMIDIHKTVFPSTFGVVSK
jgi:hypothetical protein